MSSELTESLLNVLDAAADFATIVSASKPPVRLITNLLPSTQLKRGDQYQASTLKLLEASKSIMPPLTHNIHHRTYDVIFDTRKKIVAEGILASLQEAKAIREYKEKAKTLHKTMTESSQQARSNFLWTLDDEAGSVASPESLPQNINGERTSHDADEHSMDVTDGIHQHISAGSCLTLNDPFRETASVVVQDVDMELQDDDEESDSVELSTISGRSTPCN